MLAQDQREYREYTPKEFEVAGISVLATHASAKITRHVLALFTDLYARDQANTRYQSIPAMTDCLAVLERKPQTFGTIWLLDKSGYPYLPTVTDFADINRRRIEYGIEPLRWSKSLAISENQQPWLSKPLGELIMRNPPEQEYATF